MEKELCAWLIVAAFVVGWFSCYLYKDRPAKNTGSDKEVVADPEYAEWYIQHVGYADGHSSYTVYHKSEDTVPWSHGTFDSFEGALVILNEAKARQEANRVVLKRNFIVR